MFVIFSRPHKHNQQEIEQVIELFQKGMSQFNLRKPSLNAQIYMDFINQIPLEHHQKIMVHDHHKVLCNNYNIKGIHLNKKTRTALETKQKLNNYIHQFQSQNYITSTGFRTILEIQNNNTNFDQSYLSPIFTSISKNNYKGSGIDISQYKNINTIALGGITPYNIEKTKSLGYSGIAVLGSIWNSTNPLQQYDKLSKAYQTYFI